MNVPLSFYIFNNNNNNNNLNFLLAGKNMEGLVGEKKDFITDTEGNWEPVKIDELWNVKNKQTNKQTNKQNLIS